MDLFLIVGISLIITWILSMFFITLISIVIYPFDKKNYTHPKWHTLFPYIFKIQYKEKIKNGQNLVYTTTPSLLEFPFLGDSQHSIKREVYTRDYINSKELKEMTSSIMEDQEN